MSKITEKIKRAKMLNELSILRQSLSIDDKLREEYGWSYEVFITVTNAKQNRVRELENELYK